MDKRIAVITTGLLFLVLLAGCKANSAPTSTPVPPPPTATSVPPTVAPSIPAVSTEGWTMYEVPDEQFAIALPPTWGNVDMDSSNFMASLQSAMTKYPDVASTIQGEAYSLINAGVHFFGFDPTSEAMKTGSTTDASVQRQTMGSEATLAQIEQLVRTQLANASSVKQPVSTRVIGLAAGGESLEVSFTATVSDTNGNPLDVSVFQYLTLRETDVYVITLSTNKDLSGGYVSVFQGIAASLKFLPPKRYEVSLDDDWVKGSPDAPVTIVEFSEFECPYCGNYSRDTFPQIDEAYIKTGKVKYVFRDFPLSFHENAQKAAEAAGCAGEQGKFWEYHDMLFANQSALGLDKLKQYAKDLGLDTAKFDQCLDSGARADEVAKDVADAQNYRVSSTPTFFVNGIKLKGAQPFSAFQELIEAELAKK